MEELVPDVVEEDWDWKMSGLMKSAVFFAKGILEIYENWWSLSRHRAVSFFIKRRLSLHDHQFISKKLPLGKSTFHLIKKMNSCHLLKLIWAGIISFSLFKNNNHIYNLFYFNNNLLINILFFKRKGKCWLRMRLLL